MSAAFRLQHDCRTSYHGGPDAATFVREHVDGAPTITHLSSIDKVYQAYGMNLSVSTILAMMQKDKKVGGHPNLY
jgi:hypothetical protein